MFNAFQWNCCNLVYTCNIALILFLKCDVTKFRIPPCHTMSHFVDPLPLNMWRNLWMAPYRNRFVTQYITYLNIPIPIILNLFSACDFQFWIGTESIKFSQLGRLMICLMLSKFSGRKGNQKTVLIYDFQDLVGTTDQSKKLNFPHLFHCKEKCNIITNTLCFLIQYCWSVCRISKNYSTTEKYTAGAICKMRTIIKGTWNITTNIFFSR